MFRQIILSLAVVLSSTAAQAQSSESHKPLTGPQIKALTRIGAAHMGCKVLFLPEVKLSTIETEKCNEKHSRATAILKKAFAATPNDHTALEKAADQAVALYGPGQVTYLIEKSKNSAALLNLALRVVEKQVHNLHNLSVADRVSLKLDMATLKLLLTNYDVVAQEITLRINRAKYSAESCNDEKCRVQELATLASLQPQLVTHAEISAKASAEIERFDKIVFTD